MLRVIAAALTLLISGCNVVYKQNIQQGNALEQEDIDQLYLGMNKRQVLFLLGSPSIRDPFDQERWDYIQTFSRRGGKMVQRTITLRFENELLTGMTGVEDPFGADEEAPPAETVAASKKSPQTEQDPNEAAVESASEEALEEPEIRGLGERTASDREIEEQREVLDQRAPEDVTSPDIDG